MSQKASRLYSNLQNASDKTQGIKILEDALKEAASESTNKVSTSTSNKSMLSMMSGYIKSLGQAGSATVSFDKNILDLTDDVLDFGKAMVSMDVGKIFASLKEVAQPIIEGDTRLRNSVNISLGLTGG